MQPTVLVADDDGAIRDLLVLVLAEAGYDTLSAADGATAVALAVERRPDVALLDVMMPVMDGFEACRAIKDDPRTANIPVLLLTALAQTQQKVRGLDDGATDYITKPFENPELLARIRAALTEKTRRDTLATEALTDTLTGLTNRRGIEQQLDQLLAHASRSNETLSLLIFDADHFKKVNDTYGHDAGDSVLAALARRAQEAMRAQDVVGRLGGEEFVAVLPGASRSAAYTAAERLRAHIASHPVDIPGGPIRVTVSVGVATKHPDVDTDRSNLMTAADNALYEAKRGGRDRVMHADGRPTAPLSLPEPPEAARALIAALALVHAPTAAHCESVAQASWRIGSALQLPPAERAQVALAGLLHDVGKLALRPGASTHRGHPDRPDTAALRVEARAAADLLRRLPTLMPVVEPVAAQHEWWDGSGYPRGLRGEGIPLGARIIAVADAYDAISHASVDGTRNGVEAALRRAAGGRLDPAIVAATIPVLVG